MRNSRELPRGLPRRWINRRVDSLICIVELTPLVAVGRAKRHPSDQRPAIFAITSRARRRGFECGDGAELRRGLIQKILNEATFSCSLR